MYLSLFDQIWNDPEKVEDVTERLHDHIASVDQENSPERVYFLMLYNIFNEFLEYLDVLPNDRTGYARGKGEKPRIIYLTDRVFAICRRMANRRPDGPLFRNRVGKKWTPNLVSARMRTLRKKTGVKATAYTLRQSFATRAILAGMDVKTLQELMGHDDPTMILLVYSHLKGADQHLHDALKKLA